VVSVSGIRGLLVRGPWLEREEPKDDEVEERKNGEQAPGGMMACATKELYDWDEEEKERNEKHKGGAVKREKRCNGHHLVLQEDARSDGPELTHS